MSVGLRPNGVAVARDVTNELCARLGTRTPRVARPGADLLERLRHGLPLPDPGVLLRAADGWVHPGPPTVWDSFRAMVVSLGAPAPVGGGRFPDITQLSAESIDAEAGEWRLPAVAVRPADVAPGALTPTPTAAPDVDAVHVRGARVVVLGTAWAVPLAGFVLARLGADVVRIENPRRTDPFPLRDALARGQQRVELDFDTAAGRDDLVVHLADADLLVDGNTPRVLANLGLDDAAMFTLSARLSVVRLSAFADDDRPGYGLAAECRAGWAHRFDPPRLGRTSVADPVAGLLAVRAAADALAAPGSRARVSLEAAVGHLLEFEHRNA